MTAVAPGALLQEEAFDEGSIETGQRFEIGDGDMLIDLVDAGIDRPDFHALRAERRDEACVGCAAAGAFLGHRACELRQHFTRRAAQRAFGSEERLAAAMPSGRGAETMPAEDGFA